MKRSKAYVHYDEFTGGWAVYRMIFGRWELCGYFGSESAARRNAS